MDIDELLQRFNDRRNDSTAMRQYQKVKSDETLLTNEFEYRELSLMLYRSGEDEHYRDLLKLAIDRGYIGLLDELIIYYRRSGDLDFFTSMIINSSNLTIDDFINFYNFYINNNRIDQAIHVLEYAITNGYESALVYFLLGLCYLDLDRPREAINIYYSALEKGYADRNIYHNLIYLLESIGERQESERLCKSALEVGIEDVIVFQILANTEILNENRFATLNLLERARAVNQVNYAIYMMLGSVYEEIGDYDKCFEVLQEARRTNHTDSFIYDRLFHHYIRLGLKDEGIALLEEAVHKGQTNFQIFIFLAMMYFNMGRDLDALDTLIESIQKNQYNSSTYFLLKYISGYDNFIKGIVEIANSNAPDCRSYIYIAREFPEKKDEYLKRMINYMSHNNYFSRTLSVDPKFTERIVRFEHDNMINEEIIIKQSKHSFDDEILANTNIRKLVGKEFVLPTVTSHIYHDDHYYLIMERSEGKTLTELIHQNIKFDYLYSMIIKILAKINLLTPPADTNRYDLKDALLAYFKNTGFNNSLFDYLDICIKHLNEDDCAWGFRKDPHTDNWIILQDEYSPNQILILDTENKYAIPHSLEIASLLNCIPYYEDIEKRIEAVHLYINTMNHLIVSLGLEDIREFDPESFLCQYLDSVIIRCVEKIGYYSKLGAARGVDLNLVLQATIKTIEYAYDFRLIRPLESRYYDRIRALLTQFD